MLEASNLSRSYGDFVAVKEVSFSIDAGEIVGLLGHNGAGKTTIMKMLTGYLEPSAGFVRVGGHNVETDPLVAQRQLGYLPESLPVYPEMSVMAYLDYAAAMRGVPTNERPAAVAHAVAATELGDRAFAPIATLSRGYRQRVGVAQAIVHNPQYLILDEPTNGLDPTQTQQMRVLIQTLAQQATVILSTHIMQEVEALCTRAIMLRGGQLVLDEPLKDSSNTGALRVRTSASIEEVSRALGVSAGAVTALAGPSAGSLRIETSSTSDEECMRISRTLFEAGVPIAGLNVIKRDLEALFREVNEESSDVAA